MLPAAREEAFEVVRTIVDEVYHATGGFHSKISGNPSVSGLKRFMRCV